MSGNDASWQLLGQKDLPFVYELITKVEPRWWRFSRYGAEPTQLLVAMQTVAAGAVVLDDRGGLVACATLSETGGSGTGMFDFFALPNPEAEALARRFAPALVNAAFTGAPVRRLYHERFENDPELMGEITPLFEVEVTYPDFALINGSYESRTTSVLTTERFAEWRKEKAAEQ